MKRTIYYIIVTALIAASCEKIIDINLPDKDRKIVLNSVINPDSVLSVYLYQSKSILENNNPLFLEDAVAEVFQEGVSVGTMEYSGYGKYVLPGFFPSVGRLYRIEVNHPVLGAVQSEISVPSPVEILKVDTSRSIGEYGNQVFKMKVKIADPSDEINYYALSISQTSRVLDPETGGFLDSTATMNTYFRLLTDDDNGFGGDFVDQGLSYYVNDKLFFPDTYFAAHGGLRELDLEYFIFSVDSVEVEVRLDHVDPSYYFYSVSKQKYYQANGNPFSEPVQVFNNIDNGFGLFTAFSRSDSESYSIFVGREWW